MLSEEEKKERKRISQYKYYQNNKEKIAIKNKKYAQNNKEKVNLKSKKWRDKNPEKFKESEIKSRNSEKVKHNKKIYKEKNKESIAEKNKIWYSINKEKVKETKKIWNNKNPNYHNIYQKSRKSTDPLFKLTCNIRTLIYKSIVNKNYTKKSKTYEILNCSFDEFKQHLESLFEDWMVWDNYGLYNGELNHGWDIDHIIPLSSVKSEEDVIRLNHYTNLQPLCSHINRDIKRDKI